MTLYTQPLASLHAPDCNEATCLRCRVLTPDNLRSVDDWLDQADVFAKQYYEQVEGELIVTGLRIGDGRGRLVARFGNTIVRHQSGTHTVRLTQHPTGELTAAEWNAQYPEGTHVIAYPMTRADRPVVGRTRSRAWTLGGHTPVVLVDGEAGGIALTHVDVVDEQTGRRTWLLTTIRASRGQWSTLRAETAYRQSPWPNSGRNTARKDLRYWAAQGELTVWDDETTNRRAYTSNSTKRRAA
ncbi:hypothetical protein ACFXGT_08310 [Streptomyces sp. NPDC059352]|uniref:hypothetical protein n=1 Tax=Streptomyces sp. NPDC059352 TaxID=3346810 RepID=UPI0036CABCB7